MLMLREGMCACAPRVSCGGPHLCILTCYGAASKGLAVVEAWCLAAVVEGGRWCADLGGLNTQSGDQYTYTMNTF